MTDDSEQARLVDALAQTAFVVTSALNRIASDNDLSLTQLRLLGVLRGRRPQMSHLASHLGLEKSTLSGLIERAERRGLVGRARSATDGRAVEVFLTEDGDALAARVQGDVRLAVLPGASGLSSAERNHLTVLIEKLLGPTLL
ncbi:MarR family winged helix-turn-helix transcriptional regulator [Herbiconiux sp. VKM Ac-2851]|uniref:MarR family winged helix-turn-helix transcriptional regulator n=1 Tax=Herbiconiux sp. VKM Ac-2851 TaxID=2739025 RepID=UPI00156605B6|nr:MarR family transcriptional regulator [Herbiconiux sp. VKM Ac-2851]NQX35713.1 MarR family transcriptional regulator [Herbiconiux sp. VKM Ac-2851]